MEMTRKQIQISQAHADIEHWRQVELAAMRLSNAGFAHEIHRWIAEPEKLLTNAVQ
jgi:hypothetical protein